MHSCCRYFEQSFLSHILAPVRAIQENGPILLQIGQGPHSRKEQFMIHIRVYRCKQSFMLFCSSNHPKIDCILIHLADNEGSQNAACCKCSTTFMPCRICEIGREDMMLSDIGNIRKRNSRKYKEVLQDAWGAFCRYVTG